MHRRSDLKVNLFDSYILYCLKNESCECKCWQTIILVFSQANDESFFALNWGKRAERTIKAGRDKEQFLL